MSRTIIVPIVVFVGVLAASAQVVRAQVVKESDKDLDRITVEEHLGGKVPLDLVFDDDQGKPVKLGDYFNKGKPVVLTLGYYECPMLCNLVFNGLTEAVKQIDWTPGEDFQMVTVSINPEEKPQLAYAKKTNYLKSLGKPVPETGWMFLTGAEDQSRALADAVGFRYFYDAERDQYAHPAVAILVSPDGTISRYLYGIDFARQDFRLALLEASEGKIGDTIDRIILYCFHYDPDAEGYVVVAGNVMKLGGAATMLVLGLFIGALWYGERRKRARMAEAGTTSQSIVKSEKR